MSDLIPEYDYSLGTSFKYSNKGEMVDANFVKIIAPSTRQSKECAALKQSFFRAIPTDQDKDSSGTDIDTEIDGDELMIFLSMSKDIELPKVIEVGTSLLLSGVARIDGEVALNKTLIEKMSNDDLEGLIGAYMANFILASSLAKMKEK